MSTLPLSISYVSYYPMVRIIVASQQCLVTFSVNVVQLTRMFVVIIMNLSYDIILGISFIFDVRFSID